MRAWLSRLLLVVGSLTVALVIVEMLLRDPLEDLVGVGAQTRYMPTAAGDGLVHLGPGYASAIR